MFPLKATVRKLAYSKHLCIRCPVKPPVAEWRCRSCKCNTAELRLAVSTGSYYTTILLQPLATEQYGISSAFTIRWKNRIPNDTVIFLRDNNRFRFRKQLNPPKATPSAAAVSPGPKTIHTCCVLHNSHSDECWLICCCGAMWWHYCLPDLFSNFLRKGCFLPH